jgi:hypothetical protein
VSDATWQLLTTVPNMPAAQAIATLLGNHGVACQLQADTALLGEGRSCSILVEASLMHRAKWVLADARFTDEELEFLATGMLSCADGREKP